MIYKVLSLQYTILSAIMIRAPLFPGAEKMNNSFIGGEVFKNVRKTACEYVEWVSDLLTYYNILWEPNNIKLFNFMWR